jgi:hypothetical protein
VSYLKAKNTREGRRKEAGGESFIDNEINARDEVEQMSLISPTKEQSMSNECRAVHPRVDRKTEGRIAWVKITMACRR